MALVGVCRANIVRMRADNMPAVAVVGAGAVGCYFGGMLALAGVPVTLIGRSPHMEAIARDGLLLEQSSGCRRIPVAASTSIAGVRDSQLVLFSVKTVNTETAAREMQPFLSPAATVLSFQNGVDNVDRIYAATGLRAIPVVVYVAASMSAPGRLKHGGRGDLVMGHRAGWPPVPDLKPLAALFENAGIPCKISDAIEAELWTKMVMNCAYNAISALTRARYGRIIRFEPLRQIMRRVVAETVSVARAEESTYPSRPCGGHVPVGRGDERSALLDGAGYRPRKKPTEIDSLNGYVARRGPALGIPTPVSDTLSALMKLLEQSAATAPPATGSAAFPASDRPRSQPVWTRS